MSCEKRGAFNVLLEHQSFKAIITKGYWIGKYPVTQEQWEIIMRNNPSYFKNDKNNPVECVTWIYCQDFLIKLNALKLVEGKFRLPTEAE